MLGITSRLVHPLPRFPDCEPVLDAIMFVEVCVSDENRCVQGYGCLIDRCADRRKSNGITINGSFAPDCKIDRVVRELRRTRELQGCPHVVVGHLSLTTVGLSARQRDIALDDTDTQHSVLSLIR